MTECVWSAMSPLIAMIRCPRLRPQHDFIIYCYATPNLVIIRMTECVSVRVLTFVNKILK